MKNYRKLKIGEKIKRGDYAKSFTQFKPTICAGSTHTKHDVSVGLSYYRPITRKKVQKRIDWDYLLEFWGVEYGGRQVIKNILYNNYRRRKKV